MVSLLATDPQRNDEIGKAILNACNNGLNRQASLQSPVEKDDIAELLRRRMFVSYPENPADRKKQIIAFWERMKSVDPVPRKSPDAETRLVQAYPFHPDLLDRFFGKWTDLDQFQRTRGVLQTFAMALRDAEPWDRISVGRTTNLFAIAFGGRVQRGSAETGRGCQGFGPVSKIPNGRRTSKQSYPVRLRCRKGCPHAE